jgi:cytochrome c-type biogenesis protein CcmH/NrfG
MSSPASRPRRSRRRALLVLTVVGVLALAGGVWWLRRDRPPAPPSVDLSGADPEVAELVSTARQELLAEPRSAARWGRLGMVLRAHGFAAESNFCFEQAERRDPDEPRWPYYRGLTLVLTEPGEGLACLRRAVKGLEGAPEPRFRLIEVLLQQGEQAEAAQQLGEALRRAPGHPRGRLLRARLAGARQDWKGALAALEGCWEDVHTRRQAHLLGAEACQRLGEGARAEKLLARSREMPEDVPWLDPLVEQVDGLIVGVRRRLSQADLLERQGRSGDAIALLQRVVREHPREVSAWVLLGQVLRRRDDLAGAERALERAVAAGRDHVEAWFQLGVVRVFLGRKKEAAHAFREAARLKPDHTLAHFNLGICLKDTGDPTGARQAFEAALRCQPDYAPARKALGELSARKAPE